MQSMTTPQLKVDKQQLNDMEAVPSADSEVHIPGDGKRALIHSWTCMLTSMIRHGSLSHRYPREQSCRRL